MKATKKGRSKTALKGGKRDSSDVISGPIGGASLRDPASAGVEGADLALLPTVANADAGSNTPIDEAGPPRT
jgi:hypothetical protein